jgi:hypothetical protein
VCLSSAMLRSMCRAALDVPCYEYAVLRPRLPATDRVVLVPGPPERLTVPLEGMMWYRSAQRMRATLRWCSSHGPATVSSAVVDHRRQCRLNPPATMLKSRELQTGTPNARASGDFK